MALEMSNVVEDSGESLSELPFPTPGDLSDTGKDPCVM